MKKLIYLLGIFFVPLLVAAQPGTPVEEGIAWLQSTAAGLKPSAVAGEGGNTRFKPAVNTTKYSIFLRYKNGSAITPIRVWIQGQAYRVTNKKIKVTPVVRERPGIGSGSEYDTLVAATKMQVVQIVPGAVLHQAKPYDPKIVTDWGKNKIMVDYTWRGKTYTCTIPEIKILEAVRLQ